MFLHLWHLFQTFKYNSITLIMSILRGAWNVIQWLPTDWRYILRFILYGLVLRQFLQGWKTIVNRGIHVCMYIYIYIYIHVVYICAYIYIYIYI